MKRYAVFVYSDYYPGGGWSDLYGLYETIEEARTAPKSDAYFADYIELVDLEEGELEDWGRIDADGVRWHSELPEQPSIAEQWAHRFGLPLERVRVSARTEEDLSPVPRGWDITRPTANQWVSFGPPGNVKTSPWSKTAAMKAALKQYKG